MMMMAGKRGGGVTARRGEARRGDGKATARRRQGDYKATTRQKGCEGIGYGAAGGRGNEAINKRIAKNNYILITNIRPLHSSFLPHFGMTLK
jgi:hypothetical protein